MSRWRNMQDFLPSLNSDAAGAELPGTVNQSGHQRFMGIQQIGNRSGLPGVQFIISGKRIANFLHIARRSQNVFAVKNGGHLFYGQDISLNLQRRLNRPDTADPPQPQIAPERPMQPPEPFTDCSHQ